MRSEAAPPDTFRIALIGLPGTGKTCVGRELAEVLGCAFVDCDAAVEAAAGRSVAELVASEGWPAFRARESAALAEALGRDGVVIAAGGGAVESPSNRRAIARHATRVVWLQAPLATILERLGPQASERPLLSGRPAERLAALARRRTAWYAALANVGIDVRDDPPRAVAERIAAALGGTEAGA